MLDSSMPVSAITLARYIVRRANSKSVTITHLKLQKVLYYVQCQYAKHFGRRAFIDEIEAWPYGPVVRTVYSEYCSNGSLPLYEFNDTILPCTAEEKEVIDVTIDKKIVLPSRTLVNDTHGESPWKMHEEEIDQKPEITFEEILSHCSR